MEDLFRKNGIIEKVYRKGDVFVTESLTNEEYNRIVFVMNELQKYSDIVILYTSLKDSIRELNNYLKTIPFKGDYKDYSNANRLLLNVLSAFYSLIEFSNKNISEYKEVLAHNLFDNNFTYRLFYYLRIYITHRSLAITSFIGTINQQSFRVYAQIDVKSLVESKVTNAIFREELANLGKDTIFLNDYIDDFDKTADSMIYTIFSHESDKIVDYVRELKSNIPNSNENMNECFVKYSDGTNHSLLKSINNICENFSKGVIYKNGILLDSNINSACYKLFRKLAELYFNDKNALFSFN